MKRFQFRLLFKFKLLLSTYLLLFASCLWAETEQQEAIQKPVNALHEQLLNIMKSATSASFEKRYTSMEDVITTHFNTPLISRVVLSRYWKSLDEQKQTDFIKLFNRLTISTYVDRFNSFNGEAFKNLSIEAMKKNRFMVKTELLTPDESPVSFNYIVQNTDGQWKIISVIAKGVNDLSLKRAEYASVIKERGFDALIASLKQKISDLEPE